MSRCKYCMTLWPTQQTRNRHQSQCSKRADHYSNLDNNRRRTRDHVVQNSRQRTSTLPSHNLQTSIPQVSNFQSIVDNNNNSIFQVTNTLNQNNYNEVQPSSSIVPRESKEMVALGLYSLLTKSNTPLHLYDDITAWAHTAYLHNPNIFKEKPTKYDQLIPQKAREYNIERCGQIETNLTLNCSQETVLVCRVESVLQAIQSILKYLPTGEPSVMNYVDDDDILACPAIPDNIKFVNELHTGLWYSKTFGDCFCEKLKCGDTHYKRKEEHKQSFLLPVILQMDEINIDHAGNHQMEPVLISVGLHKRKYRNIPYTWRPLGYIPRLKDLKGYKRLSGEDKMKDYHQVLKFILEPLVNLQRTPFPWTFDVNGKKVHVICHVKVQFLMGDCPSNDKACAHYNSGQANYLCRICDIHKDYSHIPKTHFNFHNIKKVKRKDKHYLNNKSIYKVDDMAFDEVDLGYFDEGDIYMCSPNAPLHQFREGGIFSRVFQSFAKFFESKKVSTHDQRTYTVYYIVKKKMQDISTILSKMSTKHFWKLSWRNVDLEQSAMCGDENLGLLLLLFLALYTSCAHDKEFFGVRSTHYDKYCEFTQLCHDLLIFYRYLTKKEHKVDCKNFMYNQLLLVEFIERYVRVVNRIEGNGMKLPKVHQLVHIFLWILLHGSWKHLDEESLERTLRFIVKRPAQRTEVGQVGSERQTGKRYVEELAIRIWDRSAYTPLEAFEKEYEELKEAAEKQREEAEEQTAHAQNLDPQDERETSLNNNNVEATVNTYGHVKITKKGKDSNNLTVKHVHSNIEYQSTSYWENDVHQWFMNYYENMNEESPVIHCYTEARVKIEKQKHVYRIHPDYRGKGKWQDWVYVNYETTNNQYVLWPARLEAIILENRQHYCLVKETDLLTNQEKNTVSNSIGKKISDLNIQICERLKFVNGDNLKKYPLNNLRGPAIVIPDGKENNDKKYLLHVKPLSNWDDMFLKVKEAQVVTEWMHNNWHNEQSKFEGENAYMTKDDFRLHYVASNKMTKPSVQQAENESSTSNEN